MFDGLWKNVSQVEEVDLFFSSGGGTLLVLQLMKIILEMF